MNTLQPQIFHAYKQQSGPIIFLTSDNYLVITEWMLGSEDDEVSDVVDDILSLCCYTILEVFQLCVVDVGGQCFTSHLFTFLFHSQWNSSHGTMVVKFKSEIEAIINKDKVLWFKWQIVYWCPWLCSQLLDQFVEIWSWSTLTWSSPWVYSLSLEMILNSTVWLSAGDTGAVVCVSWQLPADCVHWSPHQHWLSWAHAVCTVPASALLEQSHQHSPTLTSPQHEEVIGVVSDSDAETIMTHDDDDDHWWYWPGWP